MEGKVSWLNSATSDNQFSIHGASLEFHPFKLENHNQYKCLIKSKHTNEILRTLVFNTHVHIHEKNDRKPKMNIEIDTSHLLSQGELKLMCNTGQKQLNFRKKEFFLRVLLDTSNENHQWTFDDQVPREKITYDLSMNQTVSILIIPDFDLEVDSGKYQCLTTNSYGSTTKIIQIDRDLLKQE